MKSIKILCSSKKRGFTLKEDIIVKGIQTNNLKNIDVCLKKNAIYLILGPSGSGKSSLAYDTIAQIGLHDLGAMCYDGVNEPEYKVDSYENMVVTIPIKQTNNNNNIRSTVGTYFSISSCLAKIYSSLLELPYDYFVFNKSENICSVCLGVGNIKKLDPHKIVDYDKKLKRYLFVVGEKIKIFIVKFYVCSAPKKRFLIQVSFVNCLRSRSKKLCME